MLCKSTAGWKGRELPGACRGCFEWMIMENEKRRPILNDDSSRCVWKGTHNAGLNVLYNSTA